MMLLFTIALAADVDPFRPSGSLASGVGTLQGESPLVLGRGLGFGVHGSFAQDLAVRDLGSSAVPLVHRVLPVELQGAYTFDKLGIRVEGFAPLYLYNDSPVSGFRGPAFGDLRLQANLPLLRKNPVFALGLVPRVELPTGNRRANIRRGIQGGLTIALGGETTAVGWVVNAGATVSPTDEFEGIGIGSTIEALGGAWWKLSPRFRVGAEVDAQVGLVKGPNGSNTFGTWHVFAQPRLKQGLGLTVGAGSGLIRGVGAPSYRAFAALTYQRTQLDTDGDGILDEDDACPNDPEDFDGFEDVDGCPEADNDNDTFVDAEDDCPNEPEDFDGFEDMDGCPEPDNDQDQILDGDDDCPDTPGVPEANGCPLEQVLDTDGDGIPDSKDACPKLPGLEAFTGCPDRDGDKVPEPRDLCPDDPIPLAEDPTTSDGCPKTVYITKDAIRIVDRILFETGKSNIRPVSFPIVDAVASLLLSHAEIRRLEIAGHTDNIGSEAYNQQLSQGRADAVRSHLIGKGISRNRLLAKGYGEQSPRDTNRTPEGRTNNRRVEFRILDQTGGSTSPSVTPAPAPPRPVPPKPGPVSPAPGPVAPAPTAAPAPAVVVPKPVEPTPPAKPIAKPDPVATEPVAPKAASELGANNPWDVQSEPRQPAPSQGNPWGAPEEVDDPIPVSNPWGAANDETAVPAVENPWGVSAPPTSPNTSDPEGAPGRLTIVFEGTQVESAMIYVDNEPIQRTAPLQALLLSAGEHQLWVRSADGTLDASRLFTIYNELETRWVLPDGGPPTTGPIQPLTLPDKRKGRRSKKRRR